jgi:hypothetical protein
LSALALWEVLRGLDRNLANSGYVFVNPKRKRGREPLPSLTLRVTIEAVFWTGGVSQGWTSHPGHTLDKKSSKSARTNLREKRKRQRGRDLERRFPYGHLPDGGGWRLLIESHPCPLDEEQSRHRKGLGGWPDDSPVPSSPPAPKAAPAKSGLRSAWFPRFVVARDATLSRRWEAVSVFGHEFSSGPR